MDLMTMKRIEAGRAERGDTRPPRVRVEDAIEAANKLLNSNAKAKAIDPNETAVANFGDDSSPVANVAQAKADLAQLRDCNGTIGDVIKAEQTLATVRTIVEKWNQDTAASQKSAAAVVAKEAADLQSKEVGLSREAIVALKEEVYQYVEARPLLKGRVFGEMSSSHHAREADWISLARAWQELLELERLPAPTVRDLEKAKGAKVGCETWLYQIDQKRLKDQEAKTLATEYKPHAEVMSQIRKLEQEISDTLAANPASGDTHYRSSEFNTVMAAIRKKLTELSKTKAHEGTQLVHGSVMQKAEALHGKALALINVVTAVNRAKAFAEIKSWKTDTEPDVRDTSDLARFIRTLKELEPLEATLLNSDSAELVRDSLNKASRMISIINNNGGRVANEIKQDESTKLASQKIDDQYEDLRKYAQAGPKEFNNIRSAAYLGAEAKGTQVEAFATLMSTLLKRKTEAQRLEAEIKELITEADPEKASDLEAKRKQLELIPTSAEQDYGEAKTLIQEASKQAITEAYKFFLARAKAISPELDPKAGSKLKGPGYQRIYDGFSQLQEWINSKAVADLTSDDIARGLEIATTLERRLGDASRVNLVAKAYNGAAGTAKAIWPNVDQGEVLGNATPQEVAHLKLHGLRTGTLGYARDRFDVDLPVAESIIGEADDKAGKITRPLANKDVITYIPELFQDALSRAKLVWDDIKVNNMDAKGTSARGVVELHLRALSQLNIMAAGKAGFALSPASIPDAEREYDIITNALKSAPIVKAMEDRSKTLRQQISRIYPAINQFLKGVSPLPVADSMELTDSLKKIEGAVQVAVASMLDGNAETTKTVSEQEKIVNQEETKLKDDYLSKQAIAQEFDRLYRRAWGLARFYHPAIGTGIKGNETPAARAAQILDSLNHSARTIQEADISGQDIAFDLAQHMIADVHIAIEDLQKIFDPKGKTPIDWMKIPPISDAAIVNVLNNVTDADMDRMIVEEQSSDRDGYLPWANEQQAIEQAISDRKYATWISHTNDVSIEAREPVVRRRKQAGRQALDHGEILVDVKRVVDSQTGTYASDKRIGGAIADISSASNSPDAIRNAFKAERLAQAAKARKPRDSRRPETPISSPPGTRGNDDNDDKVDQGYDSDVKAYQDWHDEHIAARTTASTPVDAAVTPMEEHHRALAAKGGTASIVEPTFTGHGVNLTNPNDSGLALDHQPELRELSLARVPDDGGDGHPVHHPIIREED